MLLTGQVINSLTKQGVPYASLELTDAAGNYLGFGVATDADGNFNIDAPMAEPGTFLRISSAETLTTSYPYAEYLQMYYFLIDPKIKELNPVVITPGSGKKSDNTFLILAGVGLLFWVLNKKR